MPALALPNRPPVGSAPERVVEAAPTVGGIASTPRLEEVSAPAPVTAHRAVDAVLTAVERFSAGDRHAVNLQFSVGGADLSVRVELRADEVRATFRTDSAELRSALASEWQTAACADTDRSVRLAPPVFTANEHSAFAAFSGDTTPRERDSSTRQFHDDTFSVRAAASSRTTGTNAAAIAADLSPRAAGFSPTGTALHLSTLA